MATTGATACHDDVGTTAETCTLTRRCKQVVIVNRHATQTLFATVATGETSARAAASVVTAVAAADGTVVIPPGQRVPVFKSARSQFAAVSIVGSGAATVYSIHGSDWFD